MPGMLCNSFLTAVIRELAWRVRQSLLVLHIIDRWVWPWKTHTASLSPVELRNASDRASLQRRQLFLSYFPPFCLFATHWSWPFCSAWEWSRYSSSNSGRVSKPSLSLISWELALWEQANDCLCTWLVSYTCPSFDRLVPDKVEDWCQPGQRLSLDRHGVRGWG